MNWPYCIGLITPGRKSRVIRSGTFDTSTSSIFKSSNQAVPVPLPNPVKNTATRVRPPAGASKSITSSVQSVSPPWFVPLAMTPFPPGICIWNVP